MGKEENRVWMYRFASRMVKYCHREMNMGNTGWLILDNLKAKEI